MSPFGGRLRADETALGRGVLTETNGEHLYLWPGGVELAECTGIRRQQSRTDRPIDHVAPEEVANATAALCRASAGMRSEELLTQTAVPFGYKRERRPRPRRSMRR